MLAIYIILPIVLVCAVLYILYKRFDKYLNDFYDDLDAEDR